MLEHGRVGKGLEQSLKGRSRHWQGDGKPLEGARAGRHDSLR